MAQLRTACAEIPLLTTATQDLHQRITTFILEAQQHAVNLAVGGVPPGNDTAYMQAQVPMMHVSGCQRHGCVATMLRHLVISGLHDDLCRQARIHHLDGVEAIKADRLQGA